MEGEKCTKKSKFPSTLLLSPHLLGVTLPLDDNLIIWLDVEAFLNLTSLHYSSGIKHVLKNLSKSRHFLFFSDFLLGGSFYLSGNAETCFP